MSFSIEDIFDEEFFRWQFFWFCFVVAMSFLNTVSLYQMKNNACTGFLKGMLIKDLLRGVLVVFSSMFFMIVSMVFLLFDLLDDAFSRKTLVTERWHRFRWIIFPLPSLVGHSSRGVGRGKILSYGPRPGWLFPIGTNLDWSIIFSFISGENKAQLLQQTCCCWN